MSGSKFCGHFSFSCHLDFNFIVLFEFFFLQFFENFSFTINTKFQNGYKKNVGITMPVPNHGLINQSKMYNKYNDKPTMMHSSQKSGTWASKLHLNLNST